MVHFSDVKLALVEFANNRDRRKLASVTAKLNRKRDLLSNIDEDYWPEEVALLQREIQQLAVRHVSLVNKLNTRS